MFFFPIFLDPEHLAQKLDSTWPGIIIHGTGNLMVFIILIPAVIG